MIEKDVKADEPPTTISPSAAKTSARLVPLFCVLGIVLTVLLMVAPLNRIPDPVIQLQTPPGSFLTLVGSWLPTDLGFTQNTQASQADTGYVEFLLLVALAFVIYGLYALFIARQPSESSDYRVSRRLIWGGTLLAGLIFVFTPAMLSHDVIVYISYSRVLAIYHANPYFTPPAAFPNDPYVPLNYWASSVAAYGPVWILLCGLWSLLPGPQLIAYTLVFRGFALAAHLVNTWLVAKTLTTMSRSERTVTLGMLLYALNPLTLLESSMGGHNDVFMVTFLLLGILLLALAEKRGMLTAPRGYLPAMIAFTLAALVKFTALPVVALAFVFLAWKVLHSSTTTPSFFAALRRHWKRASLVLVFSGGVALIVALAMYLPFWIGHSLSEISASFTMTPSSRFSQNSILRGIEMWHYDHHLATLSPQGVFISILRMRTLWDDLNIAVLVLLCLFGAVWLWKTPTLRTFILASLATLGALLLVTPWFFSWYVTWLIGLIAVALPVRQSRAGTALMVLTQTLAVTSFLTYLYKDGYLPFGPWEGWIFLLTLAPTLIALRLTFLLWKPTSQAE